MNYRKGSQWRKWDLHVHTPVSLVQHFGGDNAESWEAYIKDLESLPAEFKVLGINDYLFIDGYERLKKEQEQNKRLKNIDLLLPVVEFRIEKFAGIDFGALKRINLHVIFSNEVSTENIRSQFLNTLHQSYKLESGDEWNRAITRESLEELGRRVKDNIPAEKRAGLGTDVVAGFNNLNVDERQLFEALRRDCFKSKYLIALGKTEWAHLRWTDSSIATKKTLIQKADVIFTASQSIDDFNKAKEALKSQGVKDLLLDCSDAHYLSTSTENERIGNCNTWIKADTTFEGLKQIVFEPDRRVAVALINPIDTHRKICISKVTFTGSTGFPILDQVIEFNRDLVCIIGGRGSGKSALFETVAFCFNQHRSNVLDNGLRFDSGARYDQKTFIDFYQSSDEANVKVDLTFTDKDNNELREYSTLLKNRTDTCSYPFLYLGQNQIEFFADNPEEIHSTAFDTVLKQTSLSGDLFSFQSRIEQQKQALIDSNKEVERLRVSLASYDEKKLAEDRKRVESELTLLSSKETKEIIDGFNNARLKNESLKKLEDLIGDIDVELTSDGNGGKLVSATIGFEKQLRIIVDEANQLATGLNSNAKPISWAVLDSIRKEIDALKVTIDKAAILKEYGQALSLVETQLKGKTDISISYLESQKNKESEINSKLGEAEKLRQSLQRKETDREHILSVLDQLYVDYEKSYADAIEEFNKQNSTVLKGIRIEAQKKFLLTRLITSLWNLTDGRKSKNQLYFRESWMQIGDESGFDLVTWYRRFISNEDNQNVFLNFDRSQIDAIVFSDYNTLETRVSYEVEPGEFKPISQLSLGQKGTVLLKFYLSSGNDCPILIDQPEDHLDNDFIYKDLVKTILDAKDRRQIIIVTHDANLVVNGDAEQVIVAKYKDQRISHALSGSLEDVDVRAAVTTILEGGPEAFRKREKKYQLPLSL